MNQQYRVPALDLTRYCHLHVFEKKMTHEKCHIEFQAKTDNRVKFSFCHYDLKITLCTFLSSALLPWKEQTFGPGANLS